MRKRMKWNFQVLIQIWKKSNFNCFNKQVNWNKKKKTKNANHFSIAL